MGIDIKNNMDLSDYRIRKLIIRDEFGQRTKIAVHTVAPSPSRGPHDNTHVTEIKRREVGSNIAFTVWVGDGVQSYPWKEYINQKAEVEYDSEP